MPTDVVALALVTAAAWGAASPLTKLGLDRGGTAFQAALTVVGVSVVVYWVAVVATGGRLATHPPWVYALFVATGLAGTALARALAFEGVDRLGASVNSAGINTRPVWASLLAVGLLGEVVTVQMALGIAIVVAGLVALALSEGGDVAGWDLADLVFPLAAALLFGGSNVARRFAFEATRVTALEGVAMNEAAGLVGLVGFLLVRSEAGPRRALAAPRRAYAFFVAAGLLSALALFTLFEALDRGQVVVVDPLSSPTSLFAILYTAVFLRRLERVTGRLLVGAALVVAGVALITGPQVLVL